MTYEKMTGEINLDELEVQAEEVTEASAGFMSFWLPLMQRVFYSPNLCI